MKNPLNYTIFKDGEEHAITITPVTQRLQSGDIFLTGTYKLTEGEVGMGDITFDEKMEEWEYNGIGSYLNYQDAAEIAGFIQVNRAKVIDNID